VKDTLNDLKDNFNNTNDGIYSNKGSTLKSITLSPASKALEIINSGRLDKNFRCLETEESLAEINSDEEDQLGDGNFESSDKLF